MEYHVDGFDEPTAFRAGTSLLVTGPSGQLDGQILDVVTPREGERAVAITTNRDASTVLEELRARGAAADQVGVIDCTGAEGGSLDCPVGRVHSPGDLTGISLEFAKQLDDVDESVPVRVGLASVSTVLMYAELRTVFRFLHVFTARIRSGAMFGAFAMDPSMHDDKANNTLRAVFDCQAEVAGPEVALTGSGFER